MWASSARLTVPRVARGYAPRRGGVQPCPSPAPIPSVAPALQRCSYPQPGGGWSLGRVVGRVEGGGRVTECVSGYTSWRRRERWGLLLTGGGSKSAQSGARTRRQGWAAGLTWGRDGGEGKEGWVRPPSRLRRAWAGKRNARVENGSVAVSKGEPGGQGWGGALRASHGRRVKRGAEGHAGLGIWMETVDWSGAGRGGAG